MWIQTADALTQPRKCGKFKGHSGREAGSLQGVLILRVTFNDAIQTRSIN